MLNIHVVLYVNYDKKDFRVVTFCVQETMLRYSEPLLSLQSPGHNMSLLKNLEDQFRLRAASCV